VCYTIDRNTAQTGFGAIALLVDLATGVFARALLLNTSYSYGKINEQMEMCPDKLSLYLEGRLCICNLLNNFTPSTPEERRLSCSA